MVQALLAHQHTSATVYFCLICWSLALREMLEILHARDQSTKQIFYTMIVLPDDRQVRPETSRS
jgi:hypothetical protein